MHGAADQGDAGAGFNRRFGQGEAHLAGAVVGDVAHRVDVFLGRAGGDQHVLAGQRLEFEAVGSQLRQLLGFQHAARAHVAAGLAAGRRAEQVHAARTQQVGVDLGSRVAPHGLVHRRSEGDLRVGGQHQGGQQVVGHALGQARHDVGGGGGDQHQVGPAGQFDMPHGRFGGGIEEVQVYRMAGQRLEGQRSDELTAALSHHDTHLGALIAQTANQLSALVGGDTTTHTQDDAFSIEPLHRPALISRVG
ncbi:hypothetical protein D3C76_1051980 [compost metagenome]